MNIIAQIAIVLFLQTTAAEQSIPQNMQGIWETVSLEAVITDENGSAHTMQCPTVLRSFCILKNGFVDILNHRDSHLKEYMQAIERRMRVLAMDEDDDGQMVFLLDTSNRDFRHFRATIRPLKDECIQVVLSSVKHSGEKMECTYKLKRFDRKEYREVLWCLTRAGLTVEPNGNWSYQSVQQ